MAKSKRKQWTCSVCGRHATIGSADTVSHPVSLYTQTSQEVDEGIRAIFTYTICPDVECRAPHLDAEAWQGKTTSLGHGVFVDADLKRPAGIGSFRFLPATTQPLSSTVPASVLQDYTEAFLIRSLSPKASATLSRRALQGMIRDFWGVSKGTLAAELKAIEERCDAELYEAMMAMKSVGNIGAHPERDIATIIDIEPDEAQQLLDLIHLLDQEWYVARAQKQARLSRVKALAESKKPTMPPAD